MGQGLRQGPLQARQQLVLLVAHVLAQHLVAIVAGSGGKRWTDASLLTLVRRAWPFRNLGEASFRAVLDMLTGRFDTGTSRVPARLDWDRTTGEVTARPSALMIATLCGGLVGAVVELAEREPLTGAGVDQTLHVGLQVGALGENETDVVPHGAPL